MATSAALSREISHAGFSWTALSKVRWTSPSLGRVLVVAAQLVLVIVLCFYKINPSDQWQWEMMGYRTGFIALAQLPLIVLLAGKINWIGFLIGSSYERLNWLHRWTARILFLTVTIHMGFWFRDWARYDYIKVKLSTDLVTQRGFAAWCILLWIVLSSFAPIRQWNYEFFVIQHVITLVGFLVAVYLHVPMGLKVWVWVPIGFAIADRVGRTALLLYSNLSLFRFRSKQDRFWAHNATFEPLGADMTRICIRNPPFKWSAGQHVFLSCHSVAPLQSHPFTIASIPQDGRMDFLIKCKTGGSKRFFKHAQKHQTLPLTRVDAKQDQGTLVTVEGPYGHVRPLRQFDSVVLIAGGGGSTFTMPLLRDMVTSWKSANHDQSSNVVTRYIRYVWIVKSTQQVSWFATQLATVAQDVEQHQRTGHDTRVDITIHITCEDFKPAKETEGSQVKRPWPLRTSLKDLGLATSAMKEHVKPTDDDVSVHSVSDETESRPDRRGCCDSNRAQCCITTSDDVHPANALQGSSCCCDNADPDTSPSVLGHDVSRSSIDSPPSTLTEKPIRAGPHPTIPLLCGRPRVGSMIRETLEHARGESVIVVCGPSELIGDARQSVAALSDERAVHKGTGAQGIYLHTEAFDY